MAALAAMAVGASGQMKSPGERPGLSVRAKVKGGGDLALIYNDIFPHSF
jgi:hypothetical protein